MASASCSGPVMVQEPAPAPAIDLTSQSSAPAGETVYKPAAAPASATSVPKKEENSDSEWENESLYEQILDEGEDFPYSGDGECWAFAGV